MRKALCALCVFVSLLNGADPPTLFRVRVNVMHHHGRFVASIQGARGTKVWVKSVNGPQSAILDDIPNGQFLLRVVLSTGSVLARTITVGVNAGGDREIDVSFDAREAVPDTSGTNSANVVEWRQLAVPHEVIEQHQRAWEAMNRGEFDRAAELLRGAIAVWPSYHDGWVTLGVVLRSLCQADEAEAALRTAIRLNAKSYYALINLAALLGHQGRDSEAIVFARQAHGMNRNDLIANLLMGQITFSMGRYEECIPYLELAATLDPASFTNPQLTLMVAYREIGETQQALEQAEAWLQIHPGHAGRRSVETEIRRLQKKVEDSCAGPSCS